VPPPFRFFLAWGDPNGIDGEGADAWEFEFSANGNDWVPMLVEPPVDPCASCFEVVALAPAPAGFVRARAIVEGAPPSEWIQPVRAPESPLVPMLALGLIALSFLGRTKKRPRAAP